MLPNQACIYACWRKWFLSFQLRNTDMLSPLDVKISQIWSSVMSDNTLHRVGENSQQMCSSKDAVRRSNKQRGETKYHWTSLKKQPNHTQGLRSSLNGGQLRPSVHTRRCQRANLHNQTHNLRHKSCPNTRSRRTWLLSKFKTIDLNSRSRNMNSAQILTYHLILEGPLSHTIYISLADE